MVSLIAQVRARMAGLKLTQCSEEAIMNISLVAHQLYFQCPNEDKDTIIDCALYLTNLMPGFHSNHRVRGVVDSLKVLPQFVVLDCFRATAVGLIPDRMQFIQTHCRDAAVKELLEKAKKMARRTVKECFLEQFALTISAAEHEYTEYVASIQIKSYAEFTALVAEIFARALRKAAFFGDVFV